jgi:hypothetical protein
LSLDHMCRCLICRWFVKLDFSVFEKLFYFFAIRFFSVLPWSDLICEAEHWTGEWVLVKICVKNKLIHFCNKMKVGKKPTDNLRSCAVRCRMYICNKCHM